MLQAGYSIMVYPGGSREIFHTDEHSRTTELELSHRRGFIQLAVASGSPLVPVVVFNERKAYSRKNPPAWLKAFCLSRFRLPLLVFYGRWGSLAPRTGVKLGVVVGAPVEVAHVPGASKDDPAVVDAAERYRAALEKLWEAHKARFGYARDEELVIR